MTTFTYEGKNRFYLGARATLLEEGRETASEWASDKIVINPAHSWILGKFVEAERANNNKQYFALESLQMGQPSIAHAPMNINHSVRNIVGAFVASELIYPTAESAGEMENPYIESLAVMWKYYFQDEYRSVKAAHDEGHLFYSMECIPRALQTVGGSDDTTEYPYDGIRSPSYPDEINQRQVAISMVDPHFVGGALIIPPVKPGWSKADVKQVSAYMKKNWEEAERMYERVAVAGEGLDPSTWESLMVELISLAAVEH